MNLTQLLIRNLPIARNNFLFPNTISKIIVCGHANKQKSSSSSSSSSSEDEENTEKKTRSSEALSRLNTLLQQMVTKDVSQNEKTLNLAKPTNKRVKTEEAPVKSEPVEKQVVNAVKDVAETLGGDTKQTESELLMKLLNPVDSSSGASTNLSDILKGMTIEREKKTPQQSKADQVRRILQQVNTQAKSPDKSAVPRRPRPNVQVKQELVPQKISLFGSDPLSIFTDQSTLKESPSLLTWRKLYEQELKLAVTHPPANYFQEIILWTEQGKFWQFPINNEIGLDKEAEVYFADHVFLEEHLESWCPTKGPIRHFMELVCVGLSKNPFLTVEAKKEHIEWYRSYFEDKKKLLQEIGAIQSHSDKTKLIDKD